MLYFFEDDENCSPQLLTALKEKFHRSDTTQEEKIQILKLLPDKWSYIVSADLSFSQLIVLKVQQFYESDDVSTMMTDQKDTKSVKVEDQTHIRQKRLIFGNLKDVFRKFARQNPNIKIGLSKFCSLRPPHCILAGSGGTNTVCVCPIHENMKFMASGKHLLMHTHIKS